MTTEIAGRKAEIEGQLKAGDDAAAERLAEQIAAGADLTVATARSGAPRCWS